MRIKQINKDRMEELLAKMEYNNHTNLSFAKSAHSLWFRFKNYNDRNNPYAIFDDNEEIMAVCMITRLQREPYANLYEIFAVEAGYATKLYWGVMDIMKKHGVERLKMSCTPASIGWHTQNGIIGWGVDPSGSIRVDIPIADSQLRQLELREKALDNPSLVMPPEKNAAKLSKEENSFGPRKLPVVEKSIDTLGKYYLRRHLL